MVKFNAEEVITKLTPDGQYVIIMDKEGNILDVRPIVGDNQYRVNKNSTKAFIEMNEKKEYVENRPETSKEKQFIAFKNNRLQKKVDKMTIEVAAAFARVLSKLTKSSKGKLVDGRGRPLSATQLHDIMKVKESQGRLLMRKFKELDLIRTEKDKKDKRLTIYIVNKDFHSMGEKINEAFTQVYKVKLQELIDNDKIGNELGTFYKMIPYFHYQTFYLAWNPNHDIITDHSKSLTENLILKETQEQLQVAQQNHFAELVLKILPSTFSVHLNLLEDLQVIKRDVMGDSVLIQIHPEFAYRKDFETADDKAYRNTITFQFAMHKRNKSNKGRKPKGE